MKTRKQAATEIHAIMKAYEGNLSLAYSTIYRNVFRDGDAWRLTTSDKTNHYNYTA